MKTIIALAMATLLFGCATGGTEYTKVYDRKYNEYRLVQNDNPGEFVGTAARVGQVRPAGQRP